MSSCLILQTHNDIFVGSDTACSSFVKGKYYRVNNTFTKLHIIDNKIVFVAGELDAVKKTIKFLNENIINFEDIQKFLRTLPHNTDPTIYTIELLICDIVDGKSVVYQFSEYNNFIIKEHRVENDCINILSAGFKSKKTLNIAHKLLKQSKDVSFIFKQAYNQISCNEIGGNLIVYRLSDKSKVIDELIEESDIQYLPNIHLQHAVVADALVGRKVLGNELEFQATTNSGTDVAGFKFSGMGAEFNNARILSTSSSGFQICIDPKNQIMAMGSGIYSIDNKGNYIPRFNPPDNISSEKEWWTNPLLSGIQFFADGDGDIYLRGSVYAKNGYFHGTVYATDGEFTGTVHATDGDFTGYLYANDLFLNGKSILNNLKDKITGQHLDLEGLYVRNGGINTMTVKDGIIQFGTGANSVTVNSKGLTFGSDVSLKWNNITNVPDFALSSDIPNYIQDTHIDGAKILSPTIGGGNIYGMRYWNLTNQPKADRDPTGDTYLTMNSIGYLEIHQNNVPVFKLGKSANVGEQAIRFFGGDDKNYDKPFLGYNWSQGSQGKVYAFKDWDFSNANVTGVTAVFG